MPGRAFGVAGDRCIRSAGGSVPGARRAADPSGRRRRLQRLRGACLIAPVVGWPATLASAATSGLPAPTGLTAAATGSSQISLTWTAPVAVKGAPVVGYRIYAGPSSGHESLAGSATVTSGTVSGLSSGTTYYFQVAAVYRSCIKTCSDVEGSRSSEVHATTDRAAPEVRSQGIQFGPLARHVAGVRFTVLASASSGLEVLLVSDTPRVCSVSGSEVTTVKPGRCRITASQGGNADYAPAPDQTGSFQVGRALTRRGPQAITGPGPGDVATRRPVRLLASASSGLPVSFRSDTPRVCSVSGLEVTTIKPGRCTITAVQDGNARYAPAPDQTRSFQVGPVASRAPGALVGALPAVVLAARAGAVLVLRYRPRPHPRPRPPAGPRVWAEPHADPPSTVRLRVTRTHVTSTVRIEPHPAQVSSHLERAQR